MLNVLYTILLFYTSGGGVDNVLVRLSLIEQIIKDVNLCQFDGHFAQCQTLADISGIVNEFVQYDQN